MAAEQAAKEAEEEAERLAMLEREKEKEKQAKAKDKGMIGKNNTLMLNKCKCTLYKSCSISTQLKETKLYIVVLILLLSVCLWLMY